jgi:signal transduction histidine kinase
MLISTPGSFGEMALGKVVCCAEYWDRVGPMSIPRNQNAVEPRAKALDVDLQGRLLLVFVVIAGYAVTFYTMSSQERSSLTAQGLVLGISFGAIYLLLAMNSRLILDRVPAGWAEGLFFTVECSLVLGIGFVLGTGAIWLFVMPLSAFAVEMLTPRQRWLVYGALVATVILPIGLRYGAWINALVNGVTVGTAVFFVGVFAHLRLNEQQAREHAERLMADLEAANVQLAAYATQAEELAMTQERNRLAREIHDNLGHTLTIVNVQIEAAKVVMDSDPRRALDAMNKAQELTQKGLTRVRESVAALRESPVSSRPLQEAIASLVKETQSNGIVTEFNVAGEPQALEHKVALALYRVAQEGLTNVRRHARASRVDVLLDFQPRELRLEVKDNGVGAAETAGGFGLLGIRERMQLLGGRLEIRTALGKGFCLAASVPLSVADRLVHSED